MKLLILGGTGFFGSHLVEAALARDHRVTLFNRGRLNPQWFPEVEKLRGDRRGNLEALKGRQWDTVIDTSGFNSTEVQAVAMLLSRAIEHYTFISSISVYRDFSRMDLDESAPVLTVSEALGGDAPDGASYGAGKASCESTIEQCMPGRALCIRSGIMVGPLDATERFTYWVRRVALGGDVVSPAPGNFRVQLIDARDLAAWTIRMVESRIAGIFNAVGPALPLTFEKMLQDIRSATGSNARFVWVDEQFLLDQKVEPFSDLPFWIPRKEHSHAGFFAINGRRALESGLTLRPLAETARDVLASDRESGQRRSSENPARWTADREMEVLRSWTAHRNSEVLNA